jgi:hypothetical protein
LHIGHFDRVDLETSSPDQIVRLAVEMTASADALSVRRQPMLPASSADFR